MNTPQLNLSQTVERVSQMRRLGLSLRAAYEKQYCLPAQLARFQELRKRASTLGRHSFSQEDLEALRAGFREYWVRRDFSSITEIACKLPREILQQDHLLAAYAGAAAQ